MIRKFACHISPAWELSHASNESYLCLRCWLSEIRFCRFCYLKERIIQPKSYRPEITFFLFNYYRHFHISFGNCCFRFFQLRRALKNSFLLVFLQDKTLFYMFAIDTIQQQIETSNSLYESIDSRFTKIYKLDRKGFFNHYFNCNNISVFSSRWVFLYSCLHFHIFIVEYDVNW